MISIDWNSIYYLVFYFVLYSIGGWILESVYKSICERKIINSGFMYGPYCPIYGFGTLIMLFSLIKLQSNIVLLFVVSFIVLSFWEYVVAVFLEKVYHTTYWDYSSKKINIKGRVCLLNSIYWGILGVIFIKLIHPLVSKYASGLPIRIILSADITMIAVMTTDLIISSIKINTILSKFEKIKDLNDKIKEKLAEAKNEIEMQRNEEAAILIGKLQLKHHKMKIRLYRQLIRLKKVFPTMKSEAINKILNEKVDVPELRKKVKAIKVHAKLIKTKVKK